MPRIKKALPYEERKIITLEEFDIMYAKFKGEKLVPGRFVPLELQGLWREATHRPRTAYLWQHQFQIRELQLIELGIHGTHRLDYYVTNKQPIIIPGMF